MYTMFIVKAFHFVGIFGMIACLAAELVLLQGALSRSQLRTLAKVDAGYGISAVLAVAMGLTLWLVVGKPAAFYSHLLMYVKISLAGFAGILSIFPTVYYLRHRKGDDQELIASPNWLKPLVIIQLAILMCIPFLATLIANGVRIFTF